MMTNIKRALGLQPRTFAQNITQADRVDGLSKILRGGKATARERFPQQFIDGVLARADIRQVIGNFGFGLFHGRDSTESEHCAFCDKIELRISDEKQVFHCFSCRESGNAFQYLQKTLGISFYKAVQVLAAIFPAKPA